MLEPREAAARAGRLAQVALALHSAGHAEGGMGSLGRNMLKPRDATAGPGGWRKSTGSAFRGHAEGGDGAWRAWLAWQQREDR